MAFGTPVETDFLTVGSTYKFITASGQAVAIQLATFETATLLFNFDAAGTTDNLDIEILQGQRISNGNGLDGATAANDLELNTSADGFSTDDDMNGLFLVMTSGDEAGQGNLIIDSVAADDGVVLAAALSGTPSAGETYALYRLRTLAALRRLSSAPTNDNQHNAGIYIDAADGEWVLARARATGSTDTHRVRMSYQINSPAS